MAEKKLYRSARKKMLGGVCGGVSDYFNIDVTLVRLLWAAAVVFGFGTGIILYILCWIIFPEEPFYDIT